MCFLQSSHLIIKPESHLLHMPIIVNRGSAEHFLGIHIVLSVRRRWLTREKEKRL
jgi:hypothetical protein